MVVVIDPGHGGKDPGAMNKGTREKDVVLGIGLKLGKLINENYGDVKVIFTRSSDVFVPLIDRSRIANKNKADLFISIHANFCGTPAIKGVETFVLGLHRSDDNLEVAKKENSVILLEEDYSKTYQGFDPNLSESYIMFELVQDIYMDQSLSFADAIQNQFKSHLSTPDRGVKQAGFLVLRQSSMPSVLIETGFISNTTEAGYLSSEEGQQKIALSVLEAFRKFKAKKTGSSNSEIAEKPSGNENQNVSSVSNPSKEKIVIAEDVKPKPEPISPQEKTKDEKSIGQTAVPTKQAGTQVDLNNQQEQKKQETGEVQNKNLPVAAPGAYYSVQIGANTTPVEPTAANFKGLKEVRREKTDKYYRYYIGKENSVESIQPIWDKIKLKFPQSFLVYFSEGKRSIVDNAVKQ